MDQLIDMISNPAGYLAVVVVLAMACQWLAWAIRVPSLLFLIIVGFILGQGVRASDVLGQDVLYAGVSIAVGIILFEGSLGLRFAEIRDLGSSIRRLCSLTALIAWPLITLSAWIAGLTPRLAMLVGALLVVTGPTVINPIVRTLRPTKRVSALLRWEGIIVDPIGAVLATLVFQAIIASPDNRVVGTLTGLALTLLVGFGLGLGTGWLLAVLMRRHAIPDFLEGMTFLAAAISVFVLSNAIESESGLVTVTVLGVYLANFGDVRLERVREFKENLQVLFVGALFVLLAGQVSIDDVVSVWPTALVFIALLVLVVRPVSINLSLIGTETTRNERTLLTFMAPRGVIAAAVASIFALELDRRAEALARRAAEAVGPDAATLRLRADDLTELAAAARPLVPIVFLVVVATVAIYGLGVGRLAERLGLASASPQGVLIAGSSAWVIEAAERLTELRVPVRLISQDPFGVRRARQAGIPVEYTHVLSDHVADDLDIAGLGNFIGATPDDETNATAARVLGHAFGYAHAFHLPRVSPNGNGSHQSRSRHVDEAGKRVSGRIAFRPAKTFDELRAMSESGMTVRRTTLTDEFTAADFAEQYADAVVLFTVRDGKVAVATEGSVLPEGVHVIALVPSRSPSPPAVGHRARRGH